MPILINGKPLRECIPKGSRTIPPPNKLSREAYEEALRLKENHSHTEMARVLGLTKSGAASRVYRARKILEG